MLSSEGRGGRQTLMAEMIDTDQGVQWKSHGDGNAQRAVEALWAAQDGLTNRQEEAYELACNFSASDRLVDTNELAAHLSISRQKALKTLKQLERKGLVTQVLPLEPFEPHEFIHGRPTNRYKAVTEQGLLRPFEPFEPFEPQKKTIPPGARSIYAPSSEEGSNPSDTPKPKQPVERLMPDGSWESGWLICECINLNGITIEKLGNPMLRIRNMRWDMDLRAAASLFTPSKADEPSEEPQGLSEAPREASDQGDKPDWLSNF